MKKTDAKNNTGQRNENPIYMLAGDLELVENNLDLMPFSDNSNRPFVLQIGLNYSQITELIDKTANGHCYIKLVLSEKVTGSALTGKSSFFVSEPGDPISGRFISLTSRQLEILGDVAEGLRYEDIAARHYIDLETVKTHISEIYLKLDVHNATSAAAVYYKFMKGTILDPAQR